MTDDTASLINKLLRRVKTLCEKVDAQQAQIDTLKQRVHALATRGDSE